MIKIVRRLLVTLGLSVSLFASVNCFASTYDLLVVAQSTCKMSFGNSYTPKFISSVSDYVDTSAGNFAFCETDFTVPGKNGFDISLKRRFNSYTSAGELCEVEFEKVKKSFLGYTYPYECTYQIDGVTKTATYNIFFYDESYIVGSEFYDGFYAKVPTDNNIKSDDYHNWYVRPSDIISYNSNLNVAHYVRVKGAEPTKLYTKSYYKYGTEQKSQKVSVSLANGWDIPYAGMAILDSSGDDYVGVFQNLDGDVYPYEMTMYKTSSGRYGTGRVMDCNDRYTANFVNRKNVPDTLTLPNGKKYNFYISEKNGTVYYFHVTNGGIPTFICISDKYGNMIYKDEDAENGYIDTYGNSIAIYADGISFNGKMVVNYTTQYINNDTLDPLGEFKYDNTKILTVRKAEKSDGSISQSKNVTKFYMKNAQFYDAVSPFMSLPTKIEYPTGLTRNYTYGTEEDFIYKKDLWIKFHYVSAKEDKDIYANTKNSESYSYEFYSQYKKNPTYVEKSVARATDKITTSVLDDKGRPTSVEVVSGAEKLERTFSYTSGSLEAKVSDITEKRYKDNTLSCQNSISYQYDSRMNLKKETNGDYIKTCEYDIANFSMPTSQTLKKDANTTVKTVNILTADKKSIACQKTYENDLLKKTVHYSYDDAGRILSEQIVQSCSCTADAPAAAASDKILSETGYAYTDPSSQNRVLTVSKTVFGANNADNSALENILTVSKYDALGNEILHTDGNGNTRTAQYDMLGRTVKQQNPDGGITLIDYDISDRTVIVTNPDGIVMKYTYNEWGDIDSAYVVNLNENSSPTLLEKTVYDSKCRESRRIKYLNSKATEYEEIYYDGFDRKTRVTTARNSKTVSEVNYTYNYSKDSNNRLIMDITSKFSASGGYEPASVQNTYDYRGNLIAQQLKTADKTISTSYAYDLLGNKISETDAKGKTTAYEYNYDGSVSKVTDAAGNAVLSAYDMAGRKISDTDAMGSVTTYEYDAAGRNIRIVSPFDNGRTSETKMYYDKNSNVVGTAVKTADNSYSRKDTVYDSMNRPVLVKTYPSSGKTECVQYCYDIMGNTVNKVYGAAEYISDIGSAPENVSVTSYSYDRLNRLTAETDPIGKVTSYTYNLAGELTSKTTPNGKTVSYTPNIFGKYSKLAYDDETVLYEYNMLGLVVKMTDSTGVTNYTYDKFGRLTN